MIVLTAEMKNPGDGAEPDPIQPVMLKFNQFKLHRLKFRTKKIQFPERFANLTVSG